MCTTILTMLLLLVKILKHIFQNLFESFDAFSENISVYNTKFNFTNNQYLKKFESEFTQFDNSENFHSLNPSTIKQN